MKGTIKKLNEKGFGFISTGGPKDLFFHSTDLVGVTFNDLHEGDAVSFEEGTSEKGPKAVKVTLAGAESAEAEDAPAEDLAA